MTPPRDMAEETGNAVRQKRPSWGGCICGAYDNTWFKDFCGNQCCWTRETCSKCGRVYSAATGELLSKQVAS